MALKVVWTQQALSGLQEVIRYLESDWTVAEILELENNISSFIERISLFPSIYPSTSKRKGLRKGLMDKNNFILYQVKFRPKRIEIIYFRGTRQKEV